MVSALSKLEMTISSMRPLNDPKAGETSTAPKVRSKVWLSVPLLSLGVSVFTPSRYKASIPLESEVATTKCHSPSFRLCVEETTEVPSENCSP